ncbi:Thioredoxin reductase 2, mitochondrial [Frankliniella fusca]|uniref:Thioredoxin reductase 2, mitochondrial n=1 Tax=Frankliniella fusca TaxID=407009 RepID=A0AAE1LGZ5_9NEOP|nr:Thioredoxin reductase 2, mitochondrial [Frankliniella fusca]
MTRTRSGRKSVEPRRSPRKSAAAASGAKRKKAYQPNTPTRPWRLSAAMKQCEGATCKRRVVRSPGRAKELSDKEEQAIVDHLLCQADWGFPLTCSEVSALVKGYLDKKGSVSKRFKDNTPGRKWMKGFMERHQELNRLVPKFIKSARAKVDPETVNKYFDNLEKALNGVPTANILNFDETNLSDDPANKQVIVRRGEKYAVKVMTTSKTAISLMFAGTASGTLLPPYVV